MLHCTGLEIALSCHLIRPGVTGSPSMSTEGLFTGSITKFPHQPTGQSGEPTELPVYKLTFSGNR